MTVGTIRKVGERYGRLFRIPTADDQSASLGYETRTLFEILNASGAYPASGKFEGGKRQSIGCIPYDRLFRNLVPEYDDRRGEALQNPSGELDGGFSRNQEEDARALAANPLPSDRIVLEDAKINGHTVSYEGKMSVAFRTDGEDRLIGFVGRDCKGIEIDNKVYTFANNPLRRLPLLRKVRARRTIVCRSTVRDRSLCR